jgi:hypothetical protein
MSSTQTRKVRQHPPIRNIEDFWCWLNTGGNERSHSFSTRGERDAYHQAIGDAYSALEQAGVKFDTVPREAWNRWEGL